MMMEEDRWYQVMSNDVTIVENYGCTPCEDWRVLDKVLPRSNGLSGEMDAFEDECERSFL